MVLNKISIESGFPMKEIQREPQKGYIVVSCWALMLLAYLSLICAVLFILIYFQNKMP